MTALRIRNDSTDRALLVHIWYATNPLASDGDNRWLDEKGESAPSGSRIESLSPGKLIELDAVRDALAYALTCKERKASRLSSSA